MSQPICPYCGKPAACVTGADVYPHRSDLAQKPFWMCAPCGAWIGCHPGTTQPLGRLADAELRAAKRAAHEVFDPLWRTNGSRNRNRKSRERAYAALSRALGIPKGGACHIGEMDLEQCWRTVALCPDLAKELQP